MDAGVHVKNWGHFCNQSVTPTQNILLPKWPGLTRGPGDTALEMRKQGLSGEGAGPRPHAQLHPPPVSQATLSSENVGMDNELPPRVSHRCSVQGEVEEK